jgi:hypothetical protein
MGFRNLPAGRHGKFGITKITHVMVTVIKSFILNLFHNPFKMSSSALKDNITKE